MMAAASLSLFAAAAPGLEPVAERELSRLGIANATVRPGGVEFEGTHADLMRANLHLRTASRVLTRLARFNATAFHELERGAKRIPWDDFIAKGRATRLRVTCRKSRLYHSDAVAERVALVIQHVTGVPVESTGDPEDEIETAPGAQLIVVRVQHDRVTVSADSSGELLHRRGYRQAVGKAPLRETLAAAMVLESGWTTGESLVDPFCGSGTIVIEAAMIARSIAPGLGRARHDGFAFIQWPGFSRRSWASLVASAESAVITRPERVIRGSDRDAGAIEAALANAARAGVEGDIALEQLPLKSVAAGEAEGFLVTNPPYGVRVGDPAPLRDLYDAFGNVMRQRFTGWRAAILSPGGELESRLKLPLEPAFTTNNGGIPVRLIAGRIP